MATAASQYSRALQSKLSDAGLQGALQADAFRTLLQHVSEVQGDLDILYSILEQLKQSTSKLKACPASMPNIVTITTSLS